MAHPAQPATTRFFVPAPVNGYVNSGFLRYVIEVQPIDTIGRSILGQSRQEKAANVHVQVVAPEEFKKRWSEIRLSVRPQWVECQGPARGLTRREYVNLIHQVIPNNELPRERTWKQIESE